MKSWAVRTTVEILIDDKVVAKQREIKGAFVDHLTLDARALQRVGGEVGRGLTKRLAKELNLL